MHRDTVVASVRRVVGSREQVETRTFGTYPDELKQLGQWLIAEGVGIAGMEEHGGVLSKPVDRELAKGRSDGVGGQCGAREAGSRSERPIPRTAHGSVSW